MHRLLLWSVVLTGICCLAVCNYENWFLVPVATVGSPSGQAAIMAAEPHITRYFRGGASAMVLVLMGLFFRRGGRWHLEVIFAATCVVALLAYPYCVISWESRLSARAAWLQSQHEDLTWFGGDIFKSHEYRSLPLKTRLYVVDQPRQIAVLKLPTWSIQEIGIHRLPYLVQWLGYTNTFCQFVGMGWMLAVGGSCALLLGTLFRNGKVEVARIRSAVRTLTLVSLASSIAAWTWPLNSSRNMAAAARYTHRGQYHQAIDELQRAGQRWPLVCEDTWYVAQRGLLENRVGINSAYSRLYRGQLLERGGFHAQATAKYQQVVSASPRFSAVRREACRGLLRLAVRELNSGSDMTAARDLGCVVAMEPCNIKAMFALQLAHMRDGNRQAFDDVAKQFQATYAFLRFPNKRIVLAAAEERAFHSSYQEGEVDEALDHYHKMKNPRS